MPITLDVTTKEVMSLDEVVEHFSSVDLHEHGALLDSAQVLGALANNRTFLADMITDELKNVVSLQATNDYSAQVFMLGRRRDFFMRANFWPSETDTITKVSGTRVFFYGVPHDHNFDFLTVGYYGPGYVSDFYEYDFNKVIGYVGEEIDLQYTGRLALPEGRLMLYRSSLDVHEQLPGEGFSISLNVMTDFPDQVANTNQYMLNTKTRRITSLGNRASLPLLCQVASYIGDEECADILSDLLRRHPHPRGRFAAYDALSRLRPEDQESIWAKAADDAHAYVHIQARTRLTALESAFKTSSAA